MKTRPDAAFVPAGYASRDQIAAICRQLDRAVAPAATATLVMGIAASLLEHAGAANYLMATGLLFHLVGWFAGWLESGSR